MGSRSTTPVELYRYEGRVFRRMGESTGSGTVEDESAPLFTAFTLPPCKHICVVYGDDMEIRFMSDKVKEAEAFERSAFPRKGFFHTRKILCQSDFTILSVGVAGLINGPTYEP